MGVDGLTAKVSPRSSQPQSAMAASETTHKGGGIAALARSDGMNYLHVRVGWTHSSVVILVCTGTGLGNRNR